MTRGTTTLGWSQRISSVVTTDQQGINIIPVKTSSLAHLGSVSISKPVCGEVSPHPTYALSKKVWRNFSTLSLFHDRVAGGVWHGEVHVVIRMRQHGTDVPLDLVEQPAPIGGGETRLPDQRGVAPFKEVPDEHVSRKGRSASRPNI